jgi:predicted peptidase
VIWILDELLSEQPAADPARVYLVGFSMGGNGVWSLAARFPKKFAAAVPVAGGGDMSDAHRMADLPIWAVHGADDGVTLAAESRAMIDAIREAGGRPHYTELSGVGHAAVGPGLIESSEVLEWMFEQRRPDDD